MSDQVERTHERIYNQLNLLDRELDKLDKLINDFKGRDGVEKDTPKVGNKVSPPLEILYKNLPDMLNEKSERLAVITKTFEEMFY